MVFGGQNIFRFNVPVQNGLSGVLHLSSFGQMMLLENVALEFYNNTGRSENYTVYVCRAVSRPNTPAKSGLNFGQTPDYSPWFSARN